MNGIFKNPESVKNYEAYMQKYFKHEELCTRCGHTRKNHEFIKEQTDYVCTLTYRCIDGGISVMKV